MVTDDGRLGPHPDLRDIICESVNQIFLTPDAPEHYRFVSPAVPEDLTIRCQRTWHDVVAVLPHLNGGSLSAAVVQFENGANFYSIFIDAMRRSGESDWSMAGFSGGARPPEMRDKSGGFMLSGGYFVTVGGLGVVPDGGTLRVELADGSIHESQAVDGCCIVFAPAVTEPSSGDMVTATVFDADGVELNVDRVPIGGPQPA